MGGAIQSVLVATICECPITHVQKFCCFGPDVVCFRHCLFQQFPLEFLVAYSTLREIFFSDQLDGFSFFGFIQFVFLPTVPERILVHVEEPCRFGQHVV